jgi:hypothetical protein
MSATTVNDLLLQGRQIELMTYSIAEGIETQMGLTGDAQAISALTEAVACDILGFLHDEGVDLSPAFSPASSILAIKSWPR